MLKALILAFIVSTLVITAGCASGGNKPVMVGHGPLSGESEDPAEMEMIQGYRT